MPVLSSATLRFGTTFSTNLRMQQHFGPRWQAEEFELTGSYGEGISPPTFTELYGFFPGTYIGNPNLKPETSFGYEVSLRYQRGAFDAAVTGLSPMAYTTRLSTTPTLRAL